MDKKFLVINIAALISVGILLYMSYLALMNGKQMYEFNTGLFCALFCFVPSILYYLKIMKLPVWFCMLILLAIFLHALGVLIFAYDTLVYYDTLTHSYSSFVVSLCVVFTLFSLQRYNEKVKFSTPIYVIFIILIMISFGVIWETFEFIADAITGTHMQYSPWDTIRDMFSNVFGSIACSIFIIFYTRSRSVEDFIDSIELHRYLRIFLGAKKKQ